ncbi:amidase family protein [Streptomyces albus]|uniref:amidase family protein n=1 Tax=Streptomyces albus TaxID=1888 RepID=UPI003401BED8
MEGDEYGRLTACEIAGAVTGGRVSAREVAEAALARIAGRDGAVRAFTETWPERALAYAAAVDRAVREGTPLPLAGVPLGIKATQRIASPLVARLLAAGCVPVGATAVPGPGTPWQTWGTTDRGPTLNPLGPRWSPGGSSAGSAAAMAARMVPLATGSDGAGSVRIPAAWCGVLGVKTTGGLAPVRGRTVRSAHGPLARTAADAAACLAALGRAGSCSSPGAEPRRMRVAWSATLGYAATRQDIAATAHTLLEALTEAGITAPHPAATVRLPDPAACWQHLRESRKETTGPAAGDSPEGAKVPEAATGPERATAPEAEPGPKRATAPETTTAPEKATAPKGKPSPERATAPKAELSPESATAPEPEPSPERATPPEAGTGRPNGQPGPTGPAAGTAAALNAALDRLFTEVDLLATPTTPGPPHGHDGPGESMSVALTWAFNITGHPAASLPAGRTAAGEPVGLQLVAPHGREDRLLAVAAAAEREGLL